MTPLPYSFDLLYDIKTVEELHAHLTGESRCATSATDAELIQLANERGVLLPTGITMTMNSASTLDKIQKILSAQDWSPNTLDAIAEAMREAGYEIADTPDDDEDEGGPMKKPPFNPTGAKPGDGQPAPADSMLVVGPTGDEFIYAPIPSTQSELITENAQLRHLLLALADGARSKADLIASGSPTSKYCDPVQVLRALADEADCGLKE